MKLDTRLDLSLNVGKKSARTLDVELSSYDKDYHEFEIAFIELELKPTDQVHVLSAFDESGRTSLDGATIRDGKAYFSFDTTLIDREEIVTSYVYLKTNDMQVEVDAFKYDVNLSEIDEVARGVVTVYDGRYEKLVADFEAQLQEHLTGLELVYEELVREEAERDAAEDSRVSEENKRVSAESDRESAENKRASTFTYNENSRKEEFEANETVRQLNESGRESNESDRQTNETDRQLNETDRQTTELTRESNETDRESNELTRQTNESDRNASEAGRESNESDRQTNETDRNISESDRQTNELVRQSQEESREIAETARQEEYDDLIDTGVMQENINQKLEESEAEYAPRLTSLEQKDAELTTQLAQKAQQSYAEAIDLRVDNLVIPISPENANIEVTDSHNSVVKNKNFPSLKARLEESESEFAEHKLEYIEQRQQDQLKVTTVEKELNDYKSTIASVNVNQEAKQSISGHGVVSLPKNTANGQVSVSVGGETTTNLIKNGSFENDTNSDGLADNFLKFQAVPTIDSNIKVFGNYSQKITAQYVLTSSMVYGVAQDLIIPHGNKVYVSAFFKQNDYTKFSSFVRIVQLTTEWTLADIFVGKDVSHNNWERLSGIRVWDSTKPRLMVQDRGNGTNTTNDYANVDGFMAIDLTATFGTGNEPTKEQCDLMFADYFDDTKSTISASRLKSVDEDGIQESTLYLPNVGELRSLPNGVKDEIRVSDGKAELVKRVSGEINTWDLVWSGFSSAGSETENHWSLTATGLSGLISRTATVRWNLKNYNGIPYNSFVDYNHHDNLTSIISTSSDTLYLKIPKAEMEIVSSSNIKAWLEQNQVTLVHQLVEPIITPIQTSGSLISHPSGTVYVENVVADAGVHTDKVEIINTSLPIKELDQLTKMDFETGVEQELDLTEAVVSEDGLSFTHPNLASGDLVFFEYYHQGESTDGLVSVGYYDSRYTIKDSVTDKVYKWSISVADGVPSIELEEA